MYVVLVSASPITCFGGCAAAVLAHSVSRMSTTARSERGPEGIQGALSSWRDGPARQAILEFVAAASGQDGSDPVRVEERVAVFDNDGTLWCEQPVPIQMDFILRRFVQMAEADPALRDRQPWKAAYEEDHAWFATVMMEHYAGDDRNVKTLAGGVLAAYAGVSVEDFEARADRFLRAAQHPTLLRGYLECASPRTGSPTTSSPGAGATSCGRSARRCTAFPASG